MGVEIRGVILGGGGELLWSSESELESKSKSVENCDALGGGWKAVTFVKLCGGGC